MQTCDLINKSLKARFIKLIKIMLNLSFALLKYLPPELAHSLTLKLLKLKPRFA